MYLKLRKVKFHEERERERKREREREDKSRAPVLPEAGPFIRFILRIGGWLLTCVQRL